jgi:methylmalonyl-CoA carboxyltransferase large subunit
MAADEVDLQALSKRIEQLETRLRELEAANAALLPVATTAPSHAPQELSEEVLTVISAAIAAFLGVKAKIKQIRLVGSEAWAKQGRASIMGSHHLPIRR